MTDNTDKESIPACETTSEPTCLSELLFDKAAQKSMKRDRPYTGQPHTDHGIRGQEEVKGITFRDLNDCFIRAILLSAPHLVLRRYEEALKGEDAQLNGNDLFGFDLDKLDPIAVGQNLSCEVERMMGIYPNVPGLSPRKVK